MMNIMSFLTLLPRQDVYATPSFYGIIKGNEFYKEENGEVRSLNGLEIKALVLQRMEMAYKEAVKQVENIKL